MSKGLFTMGTVMGAASLACSIFVGGPSYPEAPVPISTEAAEGFKDEIQKALASGDQTGSVTFRFNESQITSYLAQLLQTQPDPFIIDPKVLLREGEMIIFGKAQSGILIANVTITTLVRVDQNSKPIIKITQSDFGPISFPQEFNDTANALLGEMLTGSLGPAALGFRLQSISISNGTMIVKGRLK